METWRLLIDAPADGATNMARDEALLELCARGAAPPTLRLYRWQPACLSLGRFQRSADIVPERCAAAGVAVVRRPSGGRALLHTCELTYAVAVPLDQPAFGGATSILATYRRVSEALVAALGLLGVPAALVPASRRRLAEVSACFAVPASYELTVAGRKLVGSAQTRRATALLQHGAIPFTRQAEQLATLLRTPAADLAARMVALEEVLGAVPAFEQVAEALVAGFRTAWDIRLEPGVWQPAELALAQQLGAQRYADPDWTFGR